MEIPGARSQGSALPSPFLAAGSSSFSEFLRAQAPELLPGARLSSPVTPLDATPVEFGGRSNAQRPITAHGTTIVALTFSGGVLIAGDRRATAGNLIAQRDIEKVFVTDEYSAIGIAGSAGLGVELARLYTVELQHYSKIEGVSLSLDGKANQLATLVRGNLDMAMAGLAVLPLFVGFDTEADDPATAGRIVSFDPTGGRFEERFGYDALGSGSLFAKSALKKLHDPSADVETATRTAIEALYDAADDDSATGGPDVARKIYPNVITVTGVDGSVKLPDERAAEIAEAVVAARSESGR
ncbi:MAG: proteasome subunit beta [Sciscionella sp.]|nr:proteasome subunit beta [Sciscionella sp.]